MKSPINILNRAYSIFRVVPFKKIWTKTRLVASDIERRIISGIPVTDILSKIPGVAARLKISPSTTISIIAGCGNRLEYLKVSLPSFLNQARTNYEVIVSIYADQERSEQYIRTHYRDQLESGKLKLVVTEAETFNLAKATNSAAIHSRSEYLFLMNIDCPFITRRSLSGIIDKFNLISSPLASFTYWGLIMVQREKFMEIGGFDTTLNDIWAPDDLDFIARYVSYYKESYKKLSPDSTFSMDIRGKQIRILKLRGAQNTQWIEHIGVRSPDFDHGDFKDTKFYARIGGTQFTKAMMMEATINYFLTHDPKVEFVACKADGEAFVVQV